jgi:hypothetical protein
MVTEALFAGSSAEAAVTVTCCGLAILEVGDWYVIESPVEELRDPGPFRVHVTPLADVSFVMVAVIATDRPWSIACGEVGETLTDIGPGDEHPPRTITIAANGAAKHARIRDMLPPHSLQND